MNLQEEYNVAEEVLSTIKIIDPLAIIAGGAPRDWSAGNTCNDIDVYMCWEYTLHSLENSLDSLGFNGFNKMGSSLKADQNNKGYENVSGMKWVIESSLHGKDVQFIVINTIERFNVLDSFDTSICKTYVPHFEINNLKAKPIIHILPVKRLMDDLNIVEYSDKLKNTRHLDKMKARYPGMVFLPHSEIVNVLGRELNDFDFYYDGVRNFETKLKKYVESL